MEPTTPESLAQGLETATSQMATLVRAPANAARLRAAPGENEWTVLQILGHCDEMIPYWLVQIQRVLDTPGTEAVPIGRSQDDPTRLAGPARGAAGNPDELIAQVEAESKKGAAKIRAFTPEQLQKKGIHPRRGEMSVEEMLEFFIVTHMNEHLEQVREALSH